jgi:hypothetical protein
MIKVHVLLPKLGGPTWTMLEETGYGFDKESETDE